MLFACFFLARTLFKIVLQVCQTTNRLWLSVVITIHLVKPNNKQYLKYVVKSRGNLSERGLEDFLILINGQYVIGKYKYQIYQLYNININ